MTYPKVTATPSTAHPGAALGVPASPSLSLIHI